MEDGSGRSRSRRRRSGGRRRRSRNHEGEELPPVGVRWKRSINDCAVVSFSFHSDAVRLRSRQLMQTVQSARSRRRRRLLRKADWVMIHCPGRRGEVVRDRSLGLR